MSLHVDSRGRLWTHWYGKPLTLYDPISEQWQVMTGADAVDTFGGFAEDQSGRVWLASSSALLYYDEKTQHLMVAATLRPDPDPNSVYWPQLALHRSAIWIATQGEVVSFDVTKNMVHRIPVPSPGSPRLWVHRGNLWLCNASGVFRLAADRAHWQEFFRTNKSPLTACEFAADGALWVATGEAGVIRIAGGVEQRFQHGPGNNASLADNVVLNAQRDSRSQLWVITPGIAVVGQFKFSAASAVISSSDQS